MAPKRAGYSKPEDESIGVNAAGETVLQGTEMDVISVRFMVNERFNRKVPYHPEMGATTFFSFLERYLKSEGVYAWRQGNLGLEAGAPWQIFGGNVLLPSGEVLNFFGRSTEKGNLYSAEKANNAYLLRPDQTLSSLGLTDGSEITIAPRDVMDFFFPFEDEDEDAGRVSLAMHAA